MVDWSFWKGFLSGVALTALAFLRGVAAIKALWPNRAKPQLLDVQYCRIEIEPTFENFWFELLVNNAGSKDCSVISVELRLPNGDISQFVWESSSTRLPKTIDAGHTERITRYGQCGGKEQYGESKGTSQRPSLEPQQNSVEGVIVVKFNTNKSIERKTTFTVGRFNF